MSSRSFAILDSVEIPMRDGTILRADIWLPGADGAWPVLLQRTPYRKEDAFGTQYISGLEFSEALRRGYAIVVQDTRGRYSSEGTFVPFEHEAEDGADTVEWLSNQAFCNGQITMFGGSYVGATQVLAASGRPEGLIAVSTHLTTARHGATWSYRSGAVELGFLLLWIIEALSGEDLRRRLGAMPPDDAQGATRLLAEMQRDPGAAFCRLPIVSPDLIALAPYVAQWFSSERAAAADDDREHLEALAQTSIPFLVSCGWNDLFLEGGIELFETIRRRWSTADEVRDRLIIGPWSHGNPSDWQGEFWLGYGASTVGLSGEQLAFFDAARAGVVPDTPIVRYFRSGSNTWHAAPDWPLPGVMQHQLFLSEAGLHDQPGQTAWSRAFISDPSQPVPTKGGAHFLPGLLQGRNSGPKDQAEIEQRPDVLVFTSDPLESDVEVTGLIHATIWVASSGQSADWTARLCEVDPAGRSIGLVDGVYRQPHCDGKATEIQVRLGHVSHLFRTGNRIRLQIASSNFPRFDRNPQSGVSSTQATMDDLVVATHTVYGGTPTASRVSLPVVSQPFPLKPTFAGP